MFARLNTLILSANSDCSPPGDMHLALDLVVIVVAPLEPQAPRDGVRLETEGGVLGRQPVQPRVCALEGTLDLHHSLGPHQAVRGGRQEALVCVHKEAALLHTLSGV